VIESEAAHDEVETQEKAIAAKLEKMEKKSKDTSLSTVKRNSAINRLAQLKSEDPLPLRKAKITAAATLKKVKKQKKKAAKATEEAKKAEAAAAQAKEDANQAAQEAKKAEEDSINAQKAANDAKEEAVRAFKEAEKSIEDLKKEGTGLPQGKIWWMERTMKEKKKYMPK